MDSTGRFTHKLRKLSHYSYDHCSECGRPLGKNEPGLAGYSKTSKEVYVGTCCEALLLERASHIYWWWSSYKRPTAETVLWRYMDFSKFVAMLTKRELYFARADRLGDIFEGARGQASRKPEWKAYCIEHFKRAARTAPGRPEGFSEDQVAQQAEDLYRQFETIGERDVRQNFVSCWHASNGESEALWRLYAPGENTGIALRTTFGKLDAALDPEYDISFGHVQYIDFSKQFAGSYDRIYWKRDSLNHEEEVRAVITEEAPVDDEEVGIGVPLLLDNAFDAVVPSPFAPVWFANVIKDLIAKYELSLCVRESALLAQPFF